MRRVTGWAPRSTGRRCARAGLSSYGHGRGFDLLGPPPGQPAERLLVAALADVAAHAAGGPSTLAVLRGGPYHRFGLAHLSERTALAGALGLLNAALLAHDEEGHAGALWRVYGADDDPFRLYHLRVTYRTATDDVVPPVELWVVLTPGEWRWAVVEEAVRTYIRGWARVTTCFREPLVDGVRALAAAVATPTG